MSREDLLLTPMVEPIPITGTADKTKRFDYDYCVGCKSQIEQETAQKIFEEIEKLLLPDRIAGARVLVITPIRWQQFTTKYIKRDVDEILNDIQETVTRINNCLNGSNLKKGLE